MRTAVSTMTIRGKGMDEKQIWFPGMQRHARWQRGKRKEHRRNVRVTLASVSAGKVPVASQRRDTNQGFPTIDT